MKKLVLVSVAALMLAATIFAPVAQAQEPVEVKANVQSVTFRPDNPFNFLVTGSIQCTEGENYDLEVAVAEADKKPSPKNFIKKKPLNIIQAAGSGVLGTCAGTTEPQSFTGELGLGEVTKNSKLWAVAFGEVCFFDSQGEFTCIFDFDIERIKIR